MGLLGVTDLYFVVEKLLQLLELSADPLVVDRLQQPGALLHRISGGECDSRSDGVVESLDSKGVQE
jgi:hypothetical protein